MIKPHNYINVQGFMVTDLRLKGNELLIYAIIYGFSQDEQGWYTGSLAYLAEWTQSSKQGVMRALKNLTDKQMIAKQDEIKGGHKYCKYRVCSNSDMQQSLTRMQQSLTRMQLSCNNNIEDNIDNNNIIADECKSVLQHLNQASGFKYKPVSSNLRLIAARLRDYTCSELCAMIDYMCKQWLTNDSMKPYLRPSTLFRASNCDNYVAWSKNSDANQIVTNRQAEERKRIEQYERETYGC